MNSSLFQPRRIRSQILIAVVLPVVILIVTLTGYLISARYNDLELSEEERGRLLTQGLSQSVSYSLLAADVPALDAIAQTALQHPLTIGVSFFDIDGTLISHKGSSVNTIEKRQLEQLYPLTIRAETAWHYIYPVGQTLIDISDDDGEVALTQPQQQLFGWLALTISRSEQIARQRQILLTAAIVAAACLLTGIIFALRIGALITAPLAQLTRAARDWAGGTTETRAEITGSDETRLMAAVLNNLADQVQHNRQQQDIKISEATANLTERNQALVDTHQKLEQALTAKDDFLARMSHELRTPLTSIIGYNQLVKTTDQTQQKSDYTDNIAHASSLLLSIIDDILDHAKLGNATLALQNEPFDLEDCFQSVINLHGASALEKELELILLIDTDVPRQVIGDAHRLQQVVNNLVGNAIKFTDEGNIVVIVSVRDKSTSHALINCEIMDSGIGIAPEQQSQLFQPFAQADNSRRREYGGTGLGLVNSKALVELMKGTIRLASTYGVGTSVSFSFRVDREEPSEESPLLPRFRYPVMVYDANHWSQHALRALISRLTTGVTLVDTLRACLQQLGAQTETELLVLSLQAAESETSYLEKRLAEVRLRYDGPIIVLSPIPDIAQRLTSTDPRLFFQVKPVQRARLLNQCDKIVSNRSTEQAGTDSGDTNKPLGGIRVLIAEDNQLNCELLGRMLGAHGADTELVNNGIQAIARAAEGGHQLLLMDLHMPRMDGLSAARAIKGGQPDLPIICLTADVAAAPKAALQAVGVTTILHKPIDEHKLVRAVCEELGIHPPTRITDSQPADVASAAQLPEVKANLRDLTEKARSSYKAQDMVSYHENMHQLLGLAGMYGERTVCAMAQELIDQTGDLLAPELIHLLGEIDTLIDGS